MIGGWLFATRIQTSSATRSETPNRARKEAFLKASSSIDASLRARFGGEFAFLLVIQELQSELKFAQAIFRAKSALEFETYREQFDRCDGLACSAGR